MDYALFKEIFYNVNEIILLVDNRDRKIILANNAAEKFYGLRVINCNVDDFEIKKDDKIYHKNSLNEEIEVDVESSVINNENKEYLLLTVKAISNKYNQNDYEVYFHALENSGDGLWAWDIETNKAFFSNTWKSMLGYEDDEIGDSLDEWAQRIHPDDIDKTIKDIRMYLYGKCPFYRSEYRVLCKDGSYKWILNRSKIVFDKNGKPSRMIGTHADITIEKNYEKEINESNKKKDKLLSIISHDLRGPMGSFNKLVKYIIENYGVFSDEELYKTFIEIDKTASSIFDLIDNLLNWAKLNNENLKIEFKELNIFRLINEIENNLSLMIRSRHISIIKNIPDNLLISGNYDSVLIILRNIFSNAIKFSFYEGKIEINVKSINGVVEIEFKDYGTGMENDVLDKINSNELRVSYSGTNNEKGSGLGLSFIKDMLKHNNGSMKIESEPGEGTTVTVLFPAKYEKPMTDIAL